MRPRGVKRDLGMIRYDNRSRAELYAGDPMLYISKAGTKYPCARGGHSNTPRTYAVEPFCVTETRFACGSMVLYDHMFVVFCARRAQKTTNEKRGSTALPKAQSANCVSPNASYCCAGSDTLNVVPSPGWLATAIVPWCSSIIFCAIDSPSRCRRRSSGCAIYRLYRSAQKYAPDHLPQCRSLYRRCQMLSCHPADTNLHICARLAG